MVAASQKTAAIATGSTSGRIACLPAVPGGAQAGAMKPKFQETIKDPARNAWHEVFKVQHYWLEINLIAQPMRVEQAGAT